MKPLFALVAFLIPFCCPELLLAQSTESSFEKYRREKKAEFETFRREKKTEFEQYRQRLNEEYSRVLGSSWSTFREEKRKDPPMRPKPVTPFSAADGDGASAGKVPVGKVVKPAPAIPDVPVTLPEPAPAAQYPVNFSFFNTPCGIGRFDTSLLSLNGTDNASVSSAWSKLTDNERLTPLVNDCLRLREEMQLCDWGYLMLVEKVAATLYPRSANSQAFLAVALLNQSGYDTRLCVKRGSLGMLYHPAHQIYGESSYIIDGKNYYQRGAIENIDAPMSSYNGDFRESPTPIRLTIDRYPRFTPRPSASRTYSSASWTMAPPFSLSVNSSVIDFFDKYPMVDWAIYGAAPLSPELKSVLWPVMKLLTDGMDELEAVNLLLSFNNYAFEYMTDGDQFGREKPFFLDENFYYPYNDCEDRAILFARLVNSILGLDVVYLKYPLHLATAVRFSPSTPVKGSYVTVDGHRYYVCDPTCIGGKAGYLAGQFSASTPEVYKILP
ncbi:MAG: hypothetical protein K2J52_04310 [Duncaniella sp.]|nr:hypothetical protein [Duncaniella sp.]